MKRGGTQFGSAARDALFGALGTKAVPSKKDACNFEAPDPTQGGVYIGWREGPITKGFKVEMDDSTMYFTTEEAARAWVAGIWKPE